jgi:hypothetical protein
MAAGIEPDIPFLLPVNAIKTWRGGSKSGNYGRLKIIQ